MLQTVQKYDPFFLEAVARVLADEGSGHVCNLVDPGGETNFGISKRSLLAAIRSEAAGYFPNDTR